MRVEVAKVMVFKKIRLIGVSSKGFQDAVEEALAQAVKTVKHIKWFEVVKYSGAVEDGRIVEYQAEVDVAFRVERD
ncbi:MAG: dodecin family protein [Candidatus Bathyarchaeia archaeon]